MLLPFQGLAQQSQQPARRYHAHLKQIKVECRAVNLDPIKVFDKTSQTVPHQSKTWIRMNREQKIISSVWKKFHVFFLRAAILSLAGCRFLHELEIMSLHLNFLQYGTSKTWASIQKGGPGWSKTPGNGTPEPKHWLFQQRILTSTQV
jgi:hypothetical protein